MTNQATLTLYIGSADPFTVEIFDADGNAQSLADVTAARFVVASALDDGLGGIEDLVFSTAVAGTLTVGDTSLVCEFPAGAEDDLLPGRYVGQAWLYFDTPGTWRACVPPVSVRVFTGIGTP